MADSKNFFISYTGADLAWAEWIAWELEAAGYSVVLQAWDFRPGTNFILEMDRAATEAEHTIAVLSPRYLGSLFAAPEWANALRTDPSGTNRTLVPIRVEPCEPEGLLGSVVRIDLVGQPEASARSILLEGVRLTRAKPESAPPFPAAARAGFDRPRFPTVLPPIFTVPYDHHPERFAGREDLLKDLENSYARGVGASRVLTGLGGIGKTQLAVEYAYRYQSRYQAVCWVRAAEASTLVADYAALADAFRLSRGDGVGEHKVQRLVLAKVRQWFKDNDNWLLIVDEAGAPNEQVDEGSGFDFLRDFLPRPARGHTLITTVDRSWGAFADLLQVEVLRPNEAETFLLRHTGAVSAKAARDVANALGFLPLALEQARAYMEEVDITPQEYLELLQRFPSVIHKGHPRDYVRTVASTWQVSFDRVRDRMPGAADLLEVFAFLAPEDIPRDGLFSNRISDLTPELRAIVDDPLRFNDAVAELRRYSLVRRAQIQGLSVHRLVQAVVRDTLHIDDRRHRAAIAVRLLEEEFPRSVGDKSKWGTCDRLVAHALACAGHADRLAVELKSAAFLLDRVLTYLTLRGRYLEGQSHAELTLRIVKAAYGESSAEYARFVMNSGDVLYELGDLHNARARLEFAVAIGEGTPATDESTMCRMLSNLGLVLVELGDMVAAKALQDRALQISESIYGPDHPEVAKIASNLGLVYYEIGDWRQARECQERALSILDTSTPVSATYIAKRRLAVVLYNTGQFAEAIEGLQAVKDYFASTLGPEHPESAKALHHLGYALWHLGQLDDARSYFESALLIFRDAYQEPHPAVARTLAGFGMVLQDQGEFESARRAQGEALTICEQVFGPNHLEVARTLDKLAFTLRRLNCLDAAKGLQERAISIFRVCAGANHPELGIPLSNHGLVLQELGDLDQAQSYHEAAVEILEACHVPDHPDTHVALSRLAVVHEWRGNLEKAQNILEKAIAVFVRTKGASHPDVARASEKLGSVLEKMNDMAGARLRREQAVEILGASLGAEHPRTRTSIARLEEFRLRIP